ncbi:head GIN domain-containing protein [Filimonas effusa]|uniref:DUF2807 domain-containing protein n=1 Tax=Filimonas effusa TaxID=2508721 RepID=A0A4Q1D956_9BACT|nr:head GIN domain-containing protein [Filimonas effusa]RXK85348.1 DUF2807 domain-containing protein [Filimonas effusa]
MRKIIAVLTLAMLSMSQLMAQNLVYDENAEIREVGAFNGIEVSGGMILYISQGAECAVAVSAEDRQFVSKIKTEVRDGVLHIVPQGGAWNGWNWGNKQLKAYITVKNLQLLRLRGAASVRLANEVAVNALRIEITGASSLKGALKGNAVKVEVSGASRAELSGSLTVFSVEVSGASTVRAYELSAATCSVEASGASNAQVTATKELSLQASGASNVSYKGEAVVKKLESSGASNVRKRD